MCQSVEVMGEVTRDAIQTTLQIAIERVRKCRSVDDAVGELLVMRQEAEADVQRTVTAMGGK